MKTIITSVLDSGVPRVKLLPETIQDEAVLNAIINRNGDEIQPDPGYTILSWERNGDSFQSLTFGRNEDAVAGTATNALVFTGNGGNTYQSDELINRQIVMVFTDSAVRVPAEWTSNYSTGVLAFTANIDEGVIIQVIHKSLL